MVKTLILGIGNNLLSDEGVGVHAADYLARDCAVPPQVRVLDGGTLSFTLAADIAAADQLIVIDAARLDAPAGTVRCFEDDAMDRFIGRGKLSVHEVGLSDLLDIARLSGDLPPRRALIGIEPRSTGWGEDLSEPVAGALPGACRLALDLAQREAQRAKREMAA